MARTVLRSRSGDIVTAIQMTDRTGIVAASAPPAAEEVKLAAGATSMGVANSADEAEPATALDSAEGAKLVEGLKLAEGLTVAEGPKAAERFKAADGLGAVEGLMPINEATPTATPASAERLNAAAEVEPVGKLEPVGGLKLVKGSKAAEVPGSTAESESVDGAPSTLVAVTEPQRPAARRIRRNIVFSCAAALFLVVGWIGGGTWGHHESGSTPAVAMGAVADQEQGGTKPEEPPTTTEPAPVPPAPVPQVAPPATEKKVTPTTKRTTKASGKTTSTSATADARADTESSAPTSTARNPMDSMTEQLQQLVGAWSWNNAPMNRSPGSWGNGR